MAGRIDSAQKAVLEARLLLSKKESAILECMAGQRDDDVSSIALIEASTGEELFTADFEGHADTDCQCGWDEKMAQLEAAVEGREVYCYNQNEVFKRLIDTSTRHEYRFKLIKAANGALSGYVGLIREGTPEYTRCLEEAAVDFGIPHGGSEMAYVRAMLSLQILRAIASRMLACDHMALRGVTIDVEAFNAQITTQDEKITRLADENRRLQAAQEAKVVAGSQRDAAKSATAKPRRGRVVRWVSAVFMLGCVYLCIQVAALRRDNMQLLLSYDSLLSSLQKAPEDTRKAILMTAGGYRSESEIPAVMMLRSGIGKKGSASQAVRQAKHPPLPEGESGVAWDAWQDIKRLWQWSTAPVRKAVKMPVLWVAVSCIAVATAFYLIWRRKHRRIGGMQSMPRSHRRIRSSPVIRKIAPEWMDMSAGMSDDIKVAWKANMNVVRKVLSPLVRVWCWLAGMGVLIWIVLRML